MAVILLHLKVLSGEVQLCLQVMRTTGLRENCFILKEYLEIVSFGISLLEDHVCNLYNVRNIFHEMQILKLV